MGASNGFLCVALQGSSSPLLPLAGLSCKRRGMSEKKSDIVNNSMDAKDEALTHEPVESLVPAEPVGQAAPRRGLVRRVFWPLVKYPAYAAFVTGSVVLILVGLEWMAERALRATYLAAVYPDHFSMVLKDYTQPVSHYDYDFVPRVCLLYNTVKGNRYEYANNAGFREPRDISLEKPDDEYRIFLTGGSTAFGLGSIGQAAQITGWYALEYRETISHYLEQILNATAPIEGKTIRVYNTAVWGYAYQHHIGRYMAKLRRYNPDLVVALDGANEIPMICRIKDNWKYFDEAQFNGVLREIFAYKFHGLSSYLTLWLKNNTYMMTYWWRGRDLFQELHVGSDADQNPDHAAHGRLDPSAMSPDELQVHLERNAATVVRMVENYHSILDNDGVKHIFALQPWFYLSHKHRDQTEEKLEELTGHQQYYGLSSSNAYKIILNAVAESAGKKGYFVVDFSRYFDDVSQWVFSDWCHLTAGANYVLAKELANQIKQNIFQRPLADGDVIDQKDMFFWEMTAPAKVVYAPEAVDAQSKPENMFMGHPREALYSSKSVPEGERLEVVLDLTQPRIMSRLRLVWGDDASVPDQWAVETSTNGLTWNPWVEADKSRLDTFSRWPGYEYFGDKPVVARYVRYRPLKTGKRTIRLRLFSLQR